VAVGLVLAVGAWGVVADDDSDRDDDRGSAVLKDWSGDDWDERGRPERVESFNRIAFFPAFENALDELDKPKIEQPAVSEIVAASSDGKTLVYTDSELKQVGFVDITDPASPIGAGRVGLPGEPTSVAVAGPYALVAVNTSEDFINTSGSLVVIKIASKKIAATIDLGGQPDSVAVSPDGRYAAVVIENERDEDLGDGAPPQLPSGFLAIVDLDGKPRNWTVRTVSLEGVADLFSEDAEPEYVDINADNVAVVTLQENNHIVLVDLETGTVAKDFSAGTVDLKHIDTIDEADEDDSPGAFVSLTDTLLGVPREPDGVAWISNKRFVTADEGDLFGGSRGFTVFGTKGKVRHKAGNDLEHIAVRLGHYPDSRSDAKGNEPESVEYARFAKDEYLFVASERSSLVFVYVLEGNRPVFKQALPAGVGPEGVLAIPGRNLLIAASEEPGVDDGEVLIFRAGLSIYQLQPRKPAYPNIVSANRRDGTPIPWGALSGLAADRFQPWRAYTVPDAFYQRARILALDVRKHPAVIDREILIKDTYGLLGAVDARFPERTFVNDDGTVNLDLEGVDLAQRGGFWVASEGDDSPEFPNLALRISPQGDIRRVVELPAETQARLRNNGLEGIAQAGRYLFVAFQREWGVADDGAAGRDPEGKVRIGRYDLVTGEWAYYYYPLDAVESPQGGWVGLSELTHLGGSRFAVIERDNQGGPSARVKRIYAFDVRGIEPQPEAPVGTVPAFPEVGKALVRDLIEEDDLTASGGLVLEKLEGLTVLPGGTGLIVTDNDGVDDSNGETALLRIPRLF
jgi:hypothetical protein